MLLVGACRIIFINSYVLYTKDKFIRQNPEDHNVLPAV